jgi:hypothetical protein
MIHLIVCLVPEASGIAGRSVYGTLCGKRIVAQHGLPMRTKIRLPSAEPPDAPCPHCLASAAPTRQARLQGSNLDPSLGALVDAGHVGTADAPGLGAGRLIDAGHTGTQNAPERVRVIGGGSVEGALLDPTLGKLIDAGHQGTRDNPGLGEGRLIREQP